MTYMMSTLTAAEMETRLRAFYATHNPGNEQNIEEIARKYRGKEAALCAKLKKKYGVAPDLGVLASAPATPSTAGPSTAAAAAAKGPKSSTVYVYDAEYCVRSAEKSGDGGALDFRSSAFDALQALRARNVRPPVEGLTPLDNVFKCRHLLPTSDPNYQKLVIAAAKKPTPGKDSNVKTSANAASNVQRVPALFETLADTYMDGPFTVLRRCFLERKRIRVVIRRVNSVRGTVSGFIKAFDKHMNMVLIDVDEVMVPFHRQETRDRERARRKREGDVSLHREEVFSVADATRNQRGTTTRFVKQLFVRGDNVVMAMEAISSSPAQPPQSQRKARASHNNDRNYLPRGS